MLLSKVEAACNYLNTQDEIEEEELNWNNLQGKLNTARTAENTAESNLQSIEEKNRIQFQTTLEATEAARQVLENAQANLKDCQDFIESLNNIIRNSHNKINKLKSQRAEDKRLIFVFHRDELQVEIDSRIEDLIGDYWTSAAAAATGPHAPTLCHFNQPDAINRFMGDPQECIRRQRDLLDEILSPSLSEERKREQEQADSNSNSINKKEKAPAHS